MPPISQGSDVKSLVDDYIKKNKVMVFSKSTCPFCLKVKDLFKNLKIEYTVLELDQHENGPEIQDTLQQISGQRSVPNVFINNNHVGGCDSTLKIHSENKLIPMIESVVNGDTYDFDLIVIGGGSGGLAAAKVAADLGMKVCVFDFVKPTPKGATWGLGGTCVNVGCIPKKLMHQAGLLGHQFQDAQKFGWEVPDEVNHNWMTMRTNVQNHIASLNWGYRVQLRDKKVDYKNSYAEFIDDHRVKAVDKRDKEIERSAKYFIVATGERPRYPDIPGAKEFCVTSDDLFSLDYSPGKTLCIGASYVSLECAGFLWELGYNVSVMVRSILLRGFDQQMAEIIGGYMEDMGIKFHRGVVPTKIEQIEEGKPGKYRVTGKTTDGQEIQDEFNTIVVAIGRDPCTSSIGLDKAGVKLNPKNNRVIVNNMEQTNVPHIFAIGDIVDGAPALTPMAIQAGRLLSARLFSASTELADYMNVPTTVFTPIEYGCIGYSEEAALDKFGEDNIEVYHQNFTPLEWTIPRRQENVSYVKLICNIRDNERVIGLHVVGPNAGEITQGYAVAMKLGAKKSDFDRTIGIHPTCSEVFTTLNVTKRSRAESTAAGC